MQFRHEVKIEVSPLDICVLRSRLKSIMQTDPHAENGIYHIRSLYFDNAEDKALREKLDGLYCREKYRLRMYNSDTSFIKLERKFKADSLGYKENTTLTKQQVLSILNKDLNQLKESENEVLLAFYTKMKNEGLRAKTVVEYTREPFVFKAGNVRVTLDTNLRTSLNCSDFLNPECITFPAKNGANILEIKWDNFLPDIIRCAVALDCRRMSAFSKYAVCRMYD